MFTKTFWKEALERALKSAAQGAVAAWGATQITSIDQAVTLAQAIAYSAASMFVLSILTSIASAPVGAVASPSVVAVATEPVEVDVPAWMTDEVDYSAENEEAVVNPTVTENAVDETDEVENKEA